MTEGGPTMKRSHKEDSRLYDLRCTICCAVLVLIAAIRPLHAQDILPGAFRVMPVERIVILSASIPNVRIRCLSL